MMVRTSLLLELHKKLAFKGGIHNEHTPREGHWLSQKVRHTEGIFKVGPKGKRRKRKGGFLRDEPLRHRAESILLRSSLLIDHDRSEATSITA